MGILQPPAPLAGQVGVIGALKYMTTTDNLATITAAGYLNNLDLAVNPIAASDVLAVTYSFNQQTQSGTFEFFTVSISHGVITLVAFANPGDVLLPVVAGNIPIFNGTTGQIKDSTVAFSNAVDTVSPLFHGTATAGDFVTVNNANKTIQDSGAAPSAAAQPFVVMSPGALTINHIAQIADANGTIKDGGVLGTAAAKAASDNAKATLASVNGATTLNHIATYSDTAGTISEDAATAINLGNIQAGDDTTKGQLLAYGGASNGHIIINPVGNTGNTAITIQNAVYGQATVLTIPDPGAVSANFIMSASSSPQSMSGGLTLSSGNITASQGNVIAGSSGNAGTMTSFPGTAANGSFIFKAINNTGNFASTLSNSNIGQATIYSLPDAGAATANVLVAGAALVSGNISQNSGTSGAVVDSGIAALNLTITKVFTLTPGQLATAGKVNIQVHPSGTSQYFIQDIKILNSTGLSGGGGDRLLAVTDGTVIWNNAGITAALLGTPVFTVWGGTGNPIANGTTQVSTAGADIYFQYTGGTTDYTLGSVQIAVTYVKVTV